jgi:multisubunit Na+/H+ antiporter MnhC subunit
MKIKFSRNLYNYSVAVMYLMLGTFLLLKYSVWQEVPSIKLCAFAIVVIAYGLFRGYRGYKASQTQNEDQDETE